MRPFAPAHIERLQAYVPGKPPELLAREYGIADPVKLDSNESALGPSPKAVAAAQAALLEMHRYPDQFELRHALAEFYKVQPEQVVLGNGSNELIDLVCRTFCLPGELAVYPHPSFVCYRASALTSQMRVSEVPMRDHLAYDMPALLSSIAPDVKLVMVANPNNPTGSYLTEKELAQLLDVVPKDAIVVLDEAYAEFADAEDYRGGLQWLNQHPGLIVLRTFSKAYGLAGLRVGYGLASAGLVQSLNRVRAAFNVNRIALAAACAALADQEHLQRHVELVAAERIRLASAFEAAGYRVAPSQGNFLLVDMEQPAGEAADRLVRRGLAVRAMPPPIGNCLRITIGTTADNDRIVDALRNFRGA